MRWGKATSWAACVVLVALLAGCAHIVGKRVDHKNAPNMLVAADGSICIVSEERFAATEVGMKVLCAWRGGGRMPDPGRVR